MNSNPVSAIVQAAKIKLDQRKIEEKNNQRKEQEQRDRIISQLKGYLYEIVCPILEQAREALEEAGISAETGNGNDPSTKEPKKTLRIGTQILIFRIENSHSEPRLTYKSSHIHNAYEYAQSPHPCVTDGNPVESYTKQHIEEIIKNFITTSIN